jgi:hypothetical protein
LHDVDDRWDLVTGGHCGDGMVTGSHDDRGRRDHCSHLGRETQRVDESQVNESVNESVHVGSCLLDCGFELGKAIRRDAHRHCDHGTESGAAQCDDPLAICLESIKNVKLAARA